jgi:hypothetical protein
MITKQDQLNVLLNNIEEEREMMELWCWKHDIPCIPSFLDYQGRLLELQREVEEGAYVPTKASEAIHAVR